MSLPKHKKETVLITGTTSGIGWGLVEVFAKNGHDVILSGRDLAKLEEIKKIAAGFGVAAHALPADLRNFSDIKKLSEFAIEKNVTALINNAGLPCPGKELQDLEISEMNDVLSMDLHAAIFLTKFLYEHFLTLGQGSIISLNSIVGREVKKNRSIYSAARWGMRGFFDSLTQEAKEKNIQILSVYPTNVKTRPNQQNAMEVDYVAAQIYTAFLQKKSELILDGRNMTVTSN